MVTITIVQCFSVMVHARKAYQHLVQAAVKSNMRHAPSVLVTIRHVHWHLFVSKKSTAFMDYLLTSC